MPVKLPDNGAEVRLGSHVMQRSTTWTAVENANAHFFTNLEPLTVSRSNAGFPPKTVHPYLQNFTIIVLLVVNIAAVLKVCTDIDSTT